LEREPRSILARLVRRREGCRQSGPDCGPHREPTPFQRAVGIDFQDALLRDGPRHGGKTVTLLELPFRVLVRLGSLSIATPGLLQRDAQLDEHVRGRKPLVDTPLQLRERPIGTSQNAPTRSVGVETRPVHGTDNVVRVAIAHHYRTLPGHADGRHESATTLVCQCYRSNRVE
jgi:hypothetical protein